MNHAEITLKNIAQCPHCWSCAMAAKDALDRIAEEKKLVAAGSITRKDGNETRTARVHPAFKDFLKMLGGG